MAALDLKDKEAVLAYLQSQLPSEPVEALEALLDASAGSDCGTPPTKTFRPWWVIANTLQANPSQLARARGASGSEVAYRDPATAIAALMRRQAALDAGLCEVPAGFEATPGGVGSARLERVYG